MQPREVEFNEEDYEYSPYPMTERVARWSKGNIDSSAGVVSVGVHSELNPDGNDRGDQLAVLLDEFVELSTGERVSIRWDRGFTVSHSMEPRLSKRHLLEHIDMSLLPDEADVEDRGESRPWCEYSRRLGELGLHVDADVLRVLPYSTEIESALAAKLRGSS